MITAIESIFTWISQILMMMGQLNIPITDNTTISVLNLGITLSVALIITIFIKRIFETRNKQHE